MSASIHVTGVSKVFRDGAREVRALEHIDLEVGANELVTLVGASGCGKSTLLRLIADLDQALAAWSAA